MFGKMIEDEKITCIKLVPTEQNPWSNKHSVFFGITSRKSDKIQKNKHHSKLNIFFIHSGFNKIKCFFTIIIITIN